VKELLVLLGKRVHDLRAAKKWSQEEFAHVSGLHRTYIGQIERGEKNISFGNLTKVAAVLGVSLSELLLGLEEGGAQNQESKQRPAGQRAINSVRRAFEIQKLIRRLSHQQAAMDRTMAALEEFAAAGSQARARSRGRATSSRTRVSKKTAKV
jgi:transcriptional regulator with XRE-family HTH domain